MGKNRNNKSNRPSNKTTPPKKKNIILVIMGKKKDEKKNDDNDRNKININNINFNKNIWDDDENEFDEENEINDKNNKNKETSKNKIDEEDEYNEDEDEDEDEEEYDDEKDEDYEYEEEEEDEEEFIEEDEDDFIEEEDKKKESNKRKRDKEIKEEEEHLDDLFNFIINGNNAENTSRAFPPILGGELINKRDKPKKKKKKENFYDYFKESSNLLPINKEIKDLKDLINLGESYDSDDEDRYVVHMKALNKCVPVLKELNTFIGMDNIKKMILDLIIFRLQNFEESNHDEMWHLVIQGSPGCGKTEVSKIIGKIYYNLGIVENDGFTQVKRSDLIGKYLGHTAAQTQEIFDKSEGGVIFIDEAYSLGNPEGRDNFSKECIDTINLNLTEKKNTVLIIAGYKDQLNESFFNYNPGLARRFKMRMSIDKYTPSELRKIYLKKLEENEWGIYKDDEENEIPVSFFDKNKDLFKFNGGDMENLWSLTKITHCRRVFGKEFNIAKKITKEDLYNALEKYKENDEVKNRDENESLKNYVLNTMYC